MKGEKYAFDFYERVERKRVSRKNFKLTITFTLELHFFSISRMYLLNLSPNRQKMFLMTFELTGSRIVQSTKMQLLHFIRLLNDYF
jgi:hypothetical protein